MNDSHLIFEQYIKITNLISEAEYEQRFDTLSGKGITPFTAIERARQLDQFHRVKLGVALETGENIDLNKMNGFDPNKLSKLMKVSKNESSIFNHYAGEYKDASFGIIPMFKLPNVINRMRTLISSGGMKNDQFKKVKDFLENVYKEDEATKDNYTETGYLPEWRSYKVYKNLTTGKERPAVLGGYSQKQAGTKEDGSTGYMPDIRGLPEPLAGKLTNQYGELDPERGISFSTQGPPKPGETRKSALGTKERDIERRDELTKPKESPKKKPAPKKKITKESFIRDDVSF